MRTVRVEEKDSSHTWLWLAAGAAVGLTVGVLVAERTSGRKLTLRKLASRGRGLASTLAGNIGPILDVALSLKDAWTAPKADDDEEFDEELEDDDLEDDLDEEDDEDDDLEDDDEDLEDDDEDDEDEEDDEEDAPDHEALDARVLVAFSNDPILAERAVEIEDVGEGDIILHGRVRNPKEVRHALTMARGVPGVTRVREKLKVYSRR